MSYTYDKAIGTVIDKVHSLLSLVTVTQDYVHGFSFILYRRWVASIQPEYHMVADETDLVRLMTSRPRALGFQKTEGTPASHTSLELGLIALTSKARSKSNAARSLWPLRRHSLSRHSFSSCCIVSPSRNDQHEESRGKVSILGEVSLE